MSIQFQFKNLNSAFLVHHYQAAGAGQLALSMERREVGAILSVDYPGLSSRLPAVLPYSGDI